jgi:hypothetical protein
MTLSERHMAVRSFGTMAEFARLAGSLRGQLLIESESMLFNQPDSIGVAANLRDLVIRHDAEWRGFAGRLPQDGWAHSIVDQL